MTTFKDELEKILLDFVRPKGQIIPYGEGEQKSAEMAGVLLQHWLDTEAKHLVQPSIQAIIELVDREIIGENEIAYGAGMQVVPKYISRKELRKEQRQKLGVKNNE